MCTECHKTFSATKGTAFYRLRTSAETVSLVMTLMAHGCPLQAIVVAFGYDERTVACWLARAGVQGQAVQAHLVEQPRDLGQVQADEIRVKTQGGLVWMALAMMIKTRLWLAGEVSEHRDMPLIRRLIERVRRCALPVPCCSVPMACAPTSERFARRFVIPCVRESLAAYRPCPGATLDRHPHLFKLPPRSNVQDRFSSSLPRSRSVIERLTSCDGPAIHRPAPSQHVVSRETPACRAQRLPSQHGASHRNASIATFRAASGSCARPCRGRALARLTLTLQSLLASRSVRPHNFCTPHARSGFSTACLWTNTLQQCARYCFTNHRWPDPWHLPLPFFMCH